MKNKQFAFWKANLFYFITNYKTYKSLKKNFNQEVYEEFAMKYSKDILKAIQVNLTIEGEENLIEKGALYVSNHGSMFDSYFTYIAIKKNHSYFVAGDLKFSQKIPFAGNIMKWTNAIFVNRSSLKEGLKSISKAQDELKKGHNLIIFPEGEITYILNQGKEDVAQFHSGSFKAAKNLKVPVIPVAIIGSDKIHKTNSLFSTLKSGEVKVIIKKPIFDFMTNDNVTTKQMADKTRQIIKNTIHKNK